MKINSKNNVYSRSFSLILTKDDSKMFLEKALSSKGKFKEKDRLFMRNLKLLPNFLVLFMPFLIGILILGFNYRLSFAQVPPEETIGAMEEKRRAIEKERELREKLEKKEEEPLIEKEPVKEEVPPKPEIKIFVKKIEVTGVTLFPEEKIREIVVLFENKELTLKEIQDIADSITLLYRKNGYITSRAYIPPQKIEEGILKIKVLENKVGELKIEGNRYFKDSLFEDKITLKKGDLFNYDVLKKNLKKINRHPDRFVKAVLQPSAEPGATDIILQVKDRLPIHTSFSYDNFGSRYIDEDRYSISLLHNNLLGNDDILTLNFQLAETSRYKSESVRYLIPLPRDWELGLYASYSESNLGRELGRFKVEGEGEVYSLFVNKSLIDGENLDLDWHLGFDYKDLKNKMLDLEVSHDRMRVVKSSLDFDVTDNWGRSLLTYEASFGIPNIMGGLKDVDFHASREGSGGEFVKHNIDFLRLQSMPFDSRLLWRNQFQISPYILTAAEQFQIGGITSVRGYPPAEHVGDKGVASSIEWHFPPYFLPKNLKIPFSQESFYNSLRIVGFYDFGWAKLRHPTEAEEKTETLRGAGFGLHLNIGERFSSRVEVGYPIKGDKPSDNNDPHIWIEVIMKLF